MLKKNQKLNFQSVKKRRLPKEGAIIAAIDIGAAKTVCFIARMMPLPDGGVDCDIIGAGHYGALRNHKNNNSHHKDDSPSDASYKGASSTSFSAREKAIRSAVEAAERHAGVRINDVHVCVPNHAVQCQNVGVDLNISGGFVTTDDIVDSLSEGEKLITPKNHIGLHTIPRGYSIDGVDVGCDPRSYRGHKLTTRLIGINCATKNIVNLNAIVESAGLTVASFVASPVMTGRATLVDDEKDLGVMVLDIGAQNIGYALYHHGRLTGCGGVKPGGDIITRDIAQAFSTPLSHAERQKILHATVLPSAGDNNRYLDIVPLNDSEPVNRVSRSDITSVVLPRLEEMYETVLKKMVKDQCDVQHLRRLVITGGGSQLQGVREHAEKVFSMKVRLGRPLFLEGAPEALSGPAFSTCSGVVDYLTQNYSAGTEFSELEDADPYQDRRSSPKRYGHGGIGTWLKDKF